MKTGPHTRRLTALAVIACGILSSHAEVREFRDVKGRPLKAELVKLRGPNVVIRGADGRDTTVPLKNFSSDDVTYICRWVAAEPAALDYRFDVKEAEKAVEAVPGLGRSSGANAYGTAEESRRAYEISLSNRCQNPIEGIRVCYRVFLVDCVEVSETGGYASVLPARKLLLKAGNFELPRMTYNGSHKFTTRSHTVHKMKAANTYGGVAERDRMRGVWVRFYRHGVQVSEYKSGTVPRCAWPENEDEKSALKDDKEKQKPLLAALTAPLTAPANPAPASAPAPRSVAMKPKTEEKIDEKDDLPEELKIFDMSDIADDKTDAKKPLPGIPKL